MGFSRQEYWSGFPFPSPGNLPYPGIEHKSPALEAEALTSEPPGMKIMTTSFKRSHACTPALGAPDPASRPPPTLTSARDSWTLMGKSGSISCGVMLLSPGSCCTQGSVCALPESVSPVLLYGGLMVTSPKGLVP